MPSNHLLLNNSIECFVSDSKMDELMRYLRENAYDWRDARTENPLIYGILEEATCYNQTEA